MEIKIFYKLIGSTETHELNLLPEEYFDPPMKDEENYSINSIAKFIFPYEYLDYEPKDVISVNLNIRDQDSYFKREIFQWNGAKNSTDYILSFDAIKSEYFEWLITTTVVVSSEGYDVEECLRLYKSEENRWIVTGHSYRTIMPFGEEDLVKEIDIQKDSIGYVSGFRKSEF